MIPPSTCPTLAALSAATQTWVVYVIVATTALLLGLGLLRRLRRRPGCGPDCGCAGGSKVRRHALIESIIRREQSTAKGKSEVST